jgi:diguanylate cyclase (GGDEF)-like protein
MQATLAELPSGPIPLHSPFYIARPPIEELTCVELVKPGCFIRIKAPQKTGKTSLLLRILACAADMGYSTVLLNLDRADETVFASLDKFLRWFCANVSRQLKLEPLLDDYWDEDIGSKVSCTIYWQGYLLEQISSLFVLAIDRLERIFEYPAIARDFLGLLRSWHEEGKKVEILQKLRLAIVHDTEAYIPLDLNQSPFNIGLPIQLPPFTPEQVQELASRYGLDWRDPSGDSKAAREQGQHPLEMVGGHPYLVQLALHHLVNSPLERESLEPFLEKAAIATGIYRDHLRHHLAVLQEHLDLAVALKKVVTASEGVELDAITAYKLESMGLVKLKGNECTPSCELYRLYFAEQLASESFYQHRFAQLQKLSELDYLTHLKNRRYFEEQLQNQWQQLSERRIPLSLIFCEIDHFRIYDNCFGKRAGDDCLQQVAGAIRDCVRGLEGSVVSRYRGVQFAVLLPQIDATVAVSITEDIRETVKALAIAHNISCIGGLPDTVITVSQHDSRTVVQGRSGGIMARF